MRIVKISAAVAASICLFVAMSGCQERQPAEQPVSSAAPVSVAPAPTEPPVPTADELMEMMKEAGKEMEHGLEADVALDMVIETPGVTQKGTATMKMAFLGSPSADLEQMELMLDASMTVAGQEMAMSLYVKGHEIYTLYNGEKIKTHIEEMDSDSEASLPNESEILEEIEKIVDVDSLLPRNVTVERLDDGYTLSGSISGEALTAALKSLITEFATNEEEAASVVTVLDSRLNLEDIVITYATDTEGTLKNGNVHYAMGTIIDVEDINNPGETLEQEMKITADLQLNIQKIGAQVVITPPDDLDTYKTVDELYASLQ